MEATAETPRGYIARSATVEWGTPQDRFDAWNAERNYTLDVAASHENHKCGFYYTEVDNALVKPWIGRVWCNPPYGPLIGKFVEKAIVEMSKVNGPVLVDMLVPARTDVRWFHEYVWDSEFHRGKKWLGGYVWFDTSVQFLRGRLKFTGPDGKPIGPAPFPSMLIRWDRR